MLMLNRLKNLLPEIKMSFFLILISTFLILFFNKNLKEILIDNEEIIIKILYLTVIAVGISTVIHFLIPVDFVKKHLQQNKFIYLFYATVFGILTPGPV